MQRSFTFYGVLCTLGLGALAMLHSAGSTAAQQATDQTLFNLTTLASLMLRGIGP